MGDVMGVLSAGDLTELIMLQRKNTVTGAGGEITGNWVDVQRAWGMFSPLREKLELSSGGRVNGQHFRVLVYADAFENLTVRDRFKWLTDGDQILRVDLITKRPHADNALEIEVYLDE